MADKDKTINDTLRLLKSGVFMIKQKANGKTYLRRFYLNDRENFITYAGSRKLVGEARIYNIRDIDEVRPGYKTQAFHNLVKRGTIVARDENRSFSILFDNHRQEENLVAPNVKQRDLWLRGLQHLMERNASATQGHLILDEKWIIGFFVEADKDKSDTLSKKECRDLLRDSFNVDMPDHIFEQMFTDADKSKEGLLSAQEFVRFFQLLTRRKDLYEIMISFSKGGRSRPINEIYLESHELLYFLYLNTKNLERPEQIQGLINAHEMSQQFREKGLLSIDGFRNLLLSEEFDIINPPNYRRVYQDMTRPLCDYYINTSYNTYLFNSQFAGAANPEAYTRVLLMGGRVVDLDCYDGAENEGPIVKHGFSLVKSCTFESIIRCMEPNLFKVSPYPVILNIENHCTVDQQRLMVRTLKTILRDQLVTKPLPNKKPSILPSPEDLKYKVLIRSKTSTPAEIKREATDDDDSIFDKLAAEVVPELVELLVYSQNVPYRDYDYAKANYTGIHSTSLDEKHLITLAQNDPVRLVQQTTWRILRSFPGVLRQDSSNPDPVLSWNVGVQMAAMNYQTSDDMMALYYGKFLDNGGCGYILKPNYVRNAHVTEFNPWHSLNDLDQHLLYTITVISGQFLPRSSLKTSDIPDPYVQVTTRGLPCDDRVCKTKYVDNNGFDPIWDEKFEFRIKFPEMCLIYFSVMDYNPVIKDDRLGYFCAPIKMIQPGFRHIHLRDNKNDSTYSTIFVHIKIQVDKEL